MISDRLMMKIVLDIIYTLSIYDIKINTIKKNFESGQSVKVEFKFDGVVPAGVYGYALVLTNRLVSIGSDGQGLFDLT